MKQTKQEKERALERERGRVARAIGELPDALDIRAPEWATWMKEGVLVKLHLRRWRAQTKLEFLDFGLPEPKDANERKQVSELMTLGVKWLLPSRYVLALGAKDSGARKHLTKYARDTHWGEFVPFTAYQEWKEGNCKFERDYLGLGDEICENFEGIMREVLGMYAGQAATAYRNLKRLRPKNLELRSVRQMTEKEFVARYLERVREAIPERAAVRDSFAYETELSFIPLPSLIERDLLERERLNAKRRLEEEKARLAEETVLSKQRVLWEQERIERQALTERERAERRAQMERERLLEQMNQDVLRDMRARAEQLAQAELAEIERQTRAYIYKGLENVLESVLRNNGILVGKAAEQLRGIVKHVGVMNFTGNREIQGQIEQVETLLNTERRDKNAVMGMLNKLLAVNASSLEVTEDRMRRGRRGMAQAGMDEEDVTQVGRRGRRGGGLVTPVEE